MSENNEHYLIPDERKGDIQNGLRKMHAVAAYIDDLLNALRQSHCEYRIMDSNFIESLPVPELTCDNRRNRLVKGDAYMIVTAPNGYPYYINVTADSRSRPAPKCSSSSSTNSDYGITFEKHRNQQVFLLTFIEGTRFDLSLRECAQMNLLPIR